MRVFWVFVFYAHVSGSLCCIDSKTEVIHFPKDKFQHKAWGHMSSWTVFSFFYFMGISAPFPVSSYLPLEVFHKQGLGKAFECNRLRELPYSPILYFNNSVIFFFKKNFFAYLKIWIRKLSKLDIFNSVLPPRPVFFSLPEYCLLCFSCFVIRYRPFIQASETLTWSNIVFYSYQSHHYVFLSVFIWDMIMKLPYWILY